MVDRMGLGSTTHYHAEQQAMVSVHRPVHFKIMILLAYMYLGKLTTVHLGFQKAIKCQDGPFPDFALKSSLCLLFKKITMGYY